MGELSAAPEKEVIIKDDDNSYVRMEKTWRAARWNLRDKGPAVTALDQATGKIKTVNLPRYEDPAAKPLWKPLFDELRKRMAARGLEDTSPETLFTVKHKDDRLPPKQRVVGLIVSGTARAYSIDALGTRVLADTLAGVPVLGVFLSGADYGVVFSPVVGADSLQFALLNATDATAFMRDANTGSVWDAMGRAQSGSLAGNRLAVLSAYSAYLFAWADFYPGSEIYSP